VEHDQRTALAATREMRLDARRRLAALQRTQQALLGRADRTVQESAALLRARPARAMLVHRNQWLRTKLSVGLRAEGLDVLGEFEDGADGLGSAIAEQPDLLVVEDRLPSLSGLEVVRQSQHYLPRAVVAAQVEDERGVAPMLEAGAQAVFSRRVPPALLAEQIADYLRRAAAEPLLLTEGSPGDADIRRPRH
jgi:DNA-binding response OmpR family regulator